MVEYPKTWQDSDRQRERYQIPEGDYILELAEIGEGVEEFDEYAGENVTKYAWRFNVYNLDESVHINTVYDNQHYWTKKVTSSMHKRSNTYKFLYALDCVPEHDTETSEWMSTAINKKMIGRAEKWQNDAGEEQTGFSVARIHKYLGKTNENKSNDTEPKPAATTEGQKIDF